MNSQNLKSYGKKHAICTLLFVGIVIGVMLFFSPANTFIFFIALTFGFLIWLRLIDPNEKKFLLAIFIIGFLTRICGVLLVDTIMALQEKYYTFLGEQTIDIFGDSAYYTIRSWLVARYWHGEQLSQEMLKLIFYPTYASPEHIYGMALFHYIFGFSTVALKFINCFLSVATGIVTYFMAKEIFPPVKVAKLSAIFIVFFPSMFLWSISNLKDASIIFMISVALWSFVNFQKKGRLYYLLFLVIPIGFLFVVRQVVGTVMAFIILFSYFCLSKLRGLKKMTILLMVIIFLQSFVSFKYGESIRSIFLNKLEQILTVHKGHVIISAWSKGHFYKILDEKYYVVEPNGHPPAVAANMNLKDYVKMLAKGWAHVLFEPFPWKIYSKSLLIAYPQMVLWYFLMPFVLLGMITAARYHWHLSFVLFICLFVFVTLLALTGGNIGTDFRHRDMITPIVLVFASVGLVKINSYGRRNEKV